MMELPSESGETSLRCLPRDDGFPLNSPSLLKESSGEVRLLGGLSFSNREM